MQTRLRRVARILGVQQQMHRLAEAELARVDRMTGEVAEQRQVLIQALGEISPFHGLFQASTARTLKLLAVDEARLRADRDAQAQALLVSATRRKQTEHLVDDLRAAYGKEIEKRTWLERLDGIRPSGAAGD